MYAKLENGILKYAPRNFNTGENLILNFNKNIELMKKYGFKEVIDNKPEYDQSVQYLSVEGYTENKENIVINYKINKITTNNEPTLEDRVAELERLTQEQFKLIQELSLLREAGE